MQYRIVQALAEMSVGTDWAATAERLSHDVNVAIAAGWRPLGGVAVAHPLGGGQPSLLQTMVHGDPSDGGGPRREPDDESTGLNRPSSGR